MKKFLTVLLVIAVMFTFSFGSAFAFEAGTAPDTISDGYFENLWTEYVKTTHDYGTTDFTISKEVLSGMKAEAKVIYDTYMETATDYVTTSVAFEALFTADNTKANAFRLAAAAAQFAADKAAALGKLTAVQTFNYADTVMSKTNAQAAEAETSGTVAFVGKDYTYKAAAEKLVEYFTGEVEDADDFNADVTVENYKTASDAVKTIVANAVLPVGYATYNASGEVTGLALTGAYDLQVAYAPASAAAKTEAAGYTFPTGFDGKFFDVKNDTNLWGKDAVAAGDKVDAAAVAAVKAQNAAKYAAYIIGKTPAEVKEADKWLKVADILAENGYNYDTGILISNPVGNYPTKADKIAELEAVAAKYAAEKDAEGKLVRDAATVEKYLKEGTVAIATAGAANIDTKFNQYANLIKNSNADTLAKRLEFVKESAKGAIEGIVADAEDYEVYYAKELATVKAYAEKYAAKIDAAETEAAAKAAYTEFAGKVAKVDTADELDAIWAAKMIAAGASSEKTIYDAAAGYATYYNGTVESAKQLDTSVLDARIATLIGESGYRTQAEIKTLKEKAIEVAKGLATADEIKAAKKAVKDAVAALPTKATIADLALVQAVSDALDAYNELTTSGHGVTLTPYTNAVAQIVTAYNTDFVAKLANIDKKDEAAVKALRSEIWTARQAIVYLTDGSGNVAYMDGLRTTLKGYLDDIQAAEKEAVEKAIAAIPLTVSEADKAVVEKAREMYDAYVAKYKDMDSVYDATTFDYAATGNTAMNDGTATIGAGAYVDGLDIDITDLVKAEVVLGLNAPDPEENAKAYIQDLSIKARSVKTSKGVKITIKADVQQLLDDGFTVEYRFYRSTKSNKNFGKPMIVKSTNTYTNTKGVKGTRYYYKAKIVVKNAAGEVVGTTPLTQCLYATRVF